MKNFATKVHCGLSEDGIWIGSYPIAQASGVRVPHPLLSARHCESRVILSVVEGKRDEAICTCGGILFFEKKRRKLTTVGANNAHITTVASANY